MACRIERTNLGNINKVYAPNGAESKLYKDLEAVYKDAESALTAWAKVYTSEFQNDFGKWQAGKVPRVDMNGEPVASDVLKYLEDLPNNLISTLIVNGAYKINRNGMFEENILSGQQAAAVAANINQNTEFSVEVVGIDGKNFIVSPTNVQTMEETDDLVITTPIVVDFIQSDPQFDELITSQGTLSQAQKNTLSTLELLKQRVKISEDQKNYILDGEVELNRTSHVIDRMTGPTGQKDFYKFDGDPESFEDNRQWGNQLDDILEAVIRGETYEQALDSWERGKSSREKTGDASMTEEVVRKVYNIFKQLREEHPNAVMITQQPLMNSAKKVAGTADILLVHPDGRVSVLDLKSSIHPTSRAYPTIGQDGNEYSNHYAKRHKGNQKASKADRHKAQLSMYYAMLIANGIAPSDMLETVHMHLTDVSGSTVLDVAREPNKKHVPLADIVDKYSNDPNYEGKTVPEIEETEEFEKLLSLIKKTLEQKKQKFLRNNRSKGAEFIDRMQETINTTMRGSVVIAMTNEIWNTFKGNENFLGHFKLIAKTIADIENDRIDYKEAFKRLNDYKETLELYLPALRRMRDFYNDMYYTMQGEEIPSNPDIDSPLGKMNFLINQADYYKAKILDTTPKLHAEILWPHIRKGSMKLRVDLTKMKKQLSEIKKSKLGEKDRRYKSLKRRIEKLEQKALTKERLEEMIRDGAYMEVSNIFDTWVNPAVSSSNEVLAGIALATKEAFENARLKSVEFQQEAVRAYEKYKGNKSADNVAKFFEPFYYTADKFIGLDEEGNPQFRSEYHFKSDIDTGAFEKARAAMEQRVAKLPEKNRKAERQLWYMQNTVPATNLTYNGIVIRKSAEEILAAKEATMSQRRFENYKKGVTRNIGGTTFYLSPELTMPDPAKFGMQDTMTDSQKEFHEWMVSTYFKSQDKLPPTHRPKFRIPSVTKVNMDRAMEKGGIRNYFEYQKESLAFTQSEDLETVGDETVKAIPVLFTQNMQQKDVSLDLIQSIMRFEDAANLYEARADIAPIADALLESVKESDPIKTNSYGIGIINKAADRLGLEGFSKYQKATKNQLEAALAGFIDMQIYGKYKNREMLGKYDWGKIADSLIAAGSLTNIAANPILGVANWLNGQAMNVIEGVANQFFSSKDWAKAQALYIKHSDDFVKDLVSPYRKTLIGQLMDLYDPVQGNAKDRFGRKVSQSTAKKLWSSDTLYWTMQQGEHHIQVTGFLAMMQKTKALDNNGREVPIYEAYELVDEKIKLKEGYKLKGRTSENGLVDIEMRNSMHSINKSLHGVYNTFDKTILEQHGAGRLLMMYRKFLVPGFKRRFQTYSINYESGETREGYYNTFVRLLFKDTQNILKYMNPYTQSADVGLTDTELANVRRTATEAMIVILTLIAIQLLRAAFEEADDDEQRLYGFPLYWAMRLRSELMYYTNPKDTWRSFRAPTAAYSVIEKAVRFSSQMMEDSFTLSFEQYQKDAGFASKGDYKSWIYFLKLLGINNKYAAYDPREAIKVLELQTN